MPDQEVGRWACQRCGKTIVAAGEIVKSFHGIGAFMGHCPWDCGAWITRGFRGIQPGHVRAYRGEEWDAKAPAAPGRP
jgi:hypothetical protein